MELNIAQHEQHLSVSMSGNFTFEDNPKFREVITKVQSGAAKQVTLDVSGLNQLDSAALGMMMMLHKAGKDRSAGITIKSPKGQIKKMFELSRFYDLFTIVD